MPGKDHKPWTRQSNSRLKALPSEGAFVSVHNFGLELLFVELYPEFGWINLHVRPPTLTSLPSRTPSGTGQWRISWQVTSRTTTGGFRDAQSWKLMLLDTDCRNNCPLLAQRVAHSQNSFLSLAFSDSGTNPLPRSSLRHSWV